MQARGDGAARVFLGGMCRYSDVVLQKSDKGAGTYLREGGKGPAP